VDDNIRMLTKLAPFLLRTRAVVVGRPRLQQVRKRLEFVLFAHDLSANSRDKLTGQFDCPIIHALNSREIEELFGFKNTKVLGFRRGDLSRQVLKQLRRQAEKSAPAEGTARPGAGGTGKESS
jgi:hypothetical protein